MSRPRSEGHRSFASTGSQLAKNGPTFWLMRRALSLVVVLGIATKATTLLKDATIPLSTWKKSQSLSKKSENWCWRSYTRSSLARSQESRGR